MGEAQRKPLVFTGLQGRDGSTVADLEIPPNRAKDVVNCDFFRTPFARKRGGAASVSTSGGTAFSGILASLVSFTPGADPTLAQLWGFDSNFLIKRMAGGTAFADVISSDPITSRAQDVVSAVLNGKLFLAFDSAVDRLHVWDGTSLRRVGFGTSAAATVANTGAGAYAATPRYYRVAYTVQVGGITVRRSELSPSVSFTPSGAGTAARVTKPAALNDGETHWELYGSADDGTFVLLATTVVGTTTVDDSTTPSAYSGTAPPTVGSNTAPTSMKYLLSDGNRILGAGAWETPGFNNRVWYTPVLGSSGVGDDERIPNTTTLKNWIDLDENDGGFITGIGGTLDGYPFVFKYSQIWRLVPTSDVTAPYLPRAVQKGSQVGAVSHKSIVMAEDNAGRPALYFWSEQGCYRLGAEGLQYCGRDNEDLIVNLGASNVVVFGVYFRKYRQVWYWVATGSSNDPDTLLIFDTRKGRADEHGNVRGGWSKFTGDLAAARCAVMFANTLGASMSRDVKPYLGQLGGTRLYKADTGTDDNGTLFQAYVDLPERHPAGIDHNVVIKNPYVLASASSQTLQVTMTADYGAKAARTDSESFTPVGSETRLRKRFEGVEVADAGSVQFRVGDAAAVSNAWNIDALHVPYEAREIA